jgi:hypothetical protein
MRRVTGPRPATITAPAPAAPSEATSAPAHPSLVAAVLAMFAVMGATPPDDIWRVPWTTPPRR